MPLPNYHSCRLKDPADFQEGSFRRITRGKPGQTEADGRPLGIIIGRPKGKTTTVAQAYRYPIDSWTEKEAKAHCKEAGGEFHAAAEKKLLYQKQIHEHGPHTCYCPECGATKEVEEDVKCKTVECPECGAKMRAETVGEGREKMADEVSLDQIRSAIYDWLSPPTMQAEVVKDHFYVKDVYTDHAIVEGKGKLWKVPFSMGDEGIEFREMEEVRIEYVPVKALKALMEKVLDFFRPAAGVGPLGKGEKAVWTVAYMNDLPDSAFLWVEAGGTKDEDGKTVPRSLRHFPVKDAAGNFDIAHVRNAIARIPQAVDKNGDKISDALIARLQGKARGILERLQGKAFSGFKLFDQPDGSFRWLSWTTNAFQDREGEIFETKALEEYAIRAMDTGRHGELWIGHIPVKVGAPDGHIVVDRFLLETGLFDETDDGKKAMAFLAAYKEPLEMSHRYHYIQEDRKDGIYEWLDIVERSVLPAGTAANLWTSIATIEEEVKMGMPQKVVDFFKKALGEECWEQVKGDTEALTKALEKAGVEFKSLEEAEAPKDGRPPVEQPKAIEIPDEVKAAFAAVEADIKALSEKADKIDGVEKALAELKEKLDALTKSDAEKIEKKAKEETPRGTLWRASQDPQTVINDKKATELGGPKVPEIVKDIADRIGQAQG